MSPELAWSGVLIAIVSLPSLIAPRAMWELFAGFSFRNPERIEPSNRRFRVSRLSSATTLNLGLVFAVIGFWPGKLSDAGAAGLITGLIGIALIITGTIIAAATRRRRRAHDSEDNLPPNEPSDLAYGYDYFAIAFYLVLAIVLAGALVSTGQPKSVSTPTPYPPGESPADEVLSRFSIVHVIEYPVFDAVPAEMLQLRSPLFYPVDAANRKPEAAWNRSETEFADSPVMGERLSLINGALEEADLVLKYAALSCPVAGLVVVETDTTVTIGAFTKIAAVPTPAPTSTPDPDDPSKPCFRGQLISSDWYPVYLDQPLGDRELLGLDGGPLYHPSID